MTSYVALELCIYLTVKGKKERAKEFESKSSLGLNNSRGWKEGGVRSKRHENTVIFIVTEELSHGGVTRYIIDF